MRKQALFNISSSIEADRAKQYLSPTYHEQTAALISALRQKIGSAREIISHPYRIGRVNYVRVRLQGEIAPAFLLLEISGYTDLKLNLDAARLHINVCDSTDAYWLLQLLQQELCTTTVDNPV